MLKRVLISAGKTTTIAKEGNHVNVVLAAGTINARVQLKSGQVFETNLVSGMAFESPEPYVSVGFSSDTSQQCEIWLSNIPLTYSPVDARIVGSSAVESLVAEVYSGSAEILLEARSGRNKITVSPKADILIGGADLNAKNGIPVAAGAVFEFNTQGAVYGLDITGSYPASIGAVVTDSDINNPTVIQLAARPRLIFSRTSNGEFVTNHDGMGWTRYNAQTGALIATLNLVDPSSETGKEDETNFYCCSIVGNKPHFATINKADLTFTVEDIGAAAFATGRRFDVFGGKRVVYNETTKTVFVSANGGPWVQGAATTTATCSKGVALNSNGDIYCLASGQIEVSRDDGATWAIIPLAQGAAGGTAVALVIDKSTDTIYTGMDSILRRSLDDGNTFEDIGVVDDFGNNIEELVERGGTVVASCDAGFIVARTDSSGLYSGSFNFPEFTFNSFGAGIGDDGVVRIGRDNNEVYAVQGERVLSGGLEVAIMAEVN